MIVCIVLMWIIMSTLLFVGFTHHAVHIVVEKFKAVLTLSRLLPSMFQMNAGYFLIQLASERDKEKVYKEIGQAIRKDAKGVKQVCDP